ncbi:MAG: anaerobic sulfatase maturase [Clostridia bacterium]|nr:anaerobic sulfatase maturase [Clostridia bacterium]
MSGSCTKSLGMLIKPASGRCNLRCRYCFYNSPGLMGNTDEKGFMKPETAALLIKRAYDFADGPVTFAFQGGEPTLCGMDFFRYFVKKANESNIKGVKINFSIQTNGVVIDEEWADFLSKNNFLAGLSIDGPSSIHNANRIDALGNPSLAGAMNARRLFDEYKVDYNVLCVVNSLTAKNPERTYEFFKKHGIDYIQYIPCLDPAGEEPGGHDFSLTPEGYENFLKKTFDLWYGDLKSGKTVVIRTFDNYIAMLMGYMPEACGMSGKCACQFVVEADGSVYPCDFYVNQSNIIGNILYDGIEDIIKSEGVGTFLKKGLEINEKCKTCDWYFLCRDGCRRYRDPDSNLNYYCESFRNFFKYAYDRMAGIAAALSQGR